MKGITDDQFFNIKNFLASGRVFCKIHVWVPNKILIAWT